MFPTQEEHFGEGRHQQVKPRIVPPWLYLFDSITIGKRYVFCVKVGRRLASTRSGQHNLFSKLWFKIISRVHEHEKTDEANFQLCPRKERRVHGNAPSIQLYTAFWQTWSLKEITEEEKHCMQCRVNFAPAIESAKLPSSSNVFQN